MIVTLNVISNVVVTLVKFKHHSNISPEVWLQMDVDHDGIIRELEFVSHMLVSMKKVDMATIDVLREQFRALADGNPEIDMRKVRELNDLFEHREAAEKQASFKNSRQSFIGRIRRRSRQKAKTPQLHQEFSSANRYT